MSSSKMGAPAVGSPCWHRLTRSGLLQYDGTVEAGMIVYIADMAVTP